MNMTSAVGDAGPDDAGYPSSGRACPCCNGAVCRIPRRFVDLFTSIFLPVHRYRCCSVRCGWKGNLRVKRHSLLIR